MSTGDAGKVTTTGATTPARKSRFARLRSGVDRVPTKWFASIAAAVFLAGTAAFGGLATAAEPPLPELEAGDTHTSEQFSLTPLRAYISDEQITGLYALPDESQDRIAAVIDVENLWSRPVPTEDNGGLEKLLRLSGLYDVDPEAVASLSDTTASPWYQPGVPTTVVAAWLVEEGTFTVGDEITLMVRDHSLHTGSLIGSGQYWLDPVIAATVSIPLSALEPEPTPEAAL